MVLQTFDNDFTVVCLTALLIPLFLMGATHSRLSLALTRAPLTADAMPATTAPPGRVGTRPSEGCDTTDAPAQLVRELFPSEWGVPHPVGLTYSLIRNQIALLGHRDSTARGLMSELVIVTPYEDLVGQIPLRFDVDDAINIAMDDARSELLLLNTRRMEIARVAVDREGLPLRDKLVRYRIGSLGVVRASGMAVDPERRHLLILDEATSQIIRVDIDQGFIFDSRIDLRLAGKTTLRGIAIHPRSGHIYVSDLGQGMLLELTQSGEIMRRIDIAGLDLVAAGGMSFGPSADLTDGAGVYHLFIAESRLMATGLASRQVGFGTIHEVSVIPMVSEGSAETIRFLPRRR